MAKGRVSEVGERVGEQVNKTAEALGDYLKEQRTQARLSLRQLAEQAGVSNPYLSQIERGLYKPSADILRAIGGALGISSEVLYTQAGLLDPSETPQHTPVEDAIRLDESLTTEQKETLLRVYRGFLGADEPAEQTGT
jgi:transcriptional regulator with XRE-family HTH domain